MSIPIKRGYVFGKADYELRGFHGRHMRVAHDLLSCAVFLSTGEAGNLTHHATAFLIAHKGAVYIVTTKHVAESLADNPYHVRFNKVGGGDGLLPIDLGMNSEELFKWFPHPLPSVDLAVPPFPVDILAQGVEAVALDTEFILKQAVPVSDAGCGDMCPVIGLFAARAGNARNIAVVHTGHIAAMSDSKELIPTLDQGRNIDLEGYLVEISNLSGLSGAPVFVRGGVELEIPIGGSGQMEIVAHKPELRLLGVWAGSWDKPVSGSFARAPVGMGIVTPAHRLLELLESNFVVENRKAWVKKMSAAKLD